MSNPATAQQGTNLSAIFALTNNGVATTPDTLTFGSTAPAVASVDATGKLTLLSAGTTTISGAWTKTGTDGKPNSGSADGVLTVTPQGDNFVATLDFQTVAAA